MEWLHRLGSREPLVRLGSPAGYAIAAAMVILATAMRLAFDAVFADVPYSVFVPAILGASYFGGLGPGVFASALAVFIAWFVLLPPRLTFVVPTVPNGVGLIMLFCDGLMFCAVVYAFHVAVDRLRTAHRREREFAATLEQRVAERTASLEAANAALRAEIVQREAAEEVARQSQKMEVVGQLTGGIAHDFNNLLTVILASAETAVMQLRGDNPPIERLLQAVVRNSERAATLTHRLLAFSRRQELAPRDIDANALVGGMSDLIRRTLGEHIEIETALAADLWSATCDPHQLEIALLNLVVNARDAMPYGGRLTVGTANARLSENDARSAGIAPGAYVMVAVGDTGTGMPAEVVARVFEPFFTTKEPGRGTGLGLSMVYGFIKQSGGHVKIDTAMNQGTTIKLYLPRAAAASGDAARPLEVRQLAHGQAGTVVLVAEDNDDVRELVVCTLRDLGYIARAAADGPSALTLLLSEPRIDLLITDVGLPRINGRALVTEALGHRPGLQVLFTTGYTAGPLVRDGRPDAQAMMLVKPFTATALVRRVAELVGTGGAAGAEDAAAIGGRRHAT